MYKCECGSQEFLEMLMVIRKVGPKGGDNDILEVYEEITESAKCAKCESDIEWISE